MKYILISLFLIVTVVILYYIFGRTYTPDGVKPITSFELNKYLGKWYEIARLDSRFEKNLSNVTATYNLNKDGNVIVLNSGYDYANNKWKKAEGLAKFCGAKDVAALKVSFFGPFYAGYNIIALDTAYKYALVAGGDMDYLWILSRDKSVPHRIKEQYLLIAQQAGYDTTALIWVQHDKTNNPLLNEK